MIVIEKIDCEPTLKELFKPVNGNRNISIDVEDFLGIHEHLETTQLI